MYRFNRGFTLVELLVVITIIGILVALLIPVVSTVREQGRQTQCLNNQMNIGKALLGYETTKGHLPGVIDVTANGAVYTWFEALFPYLEREDLWTTISEYNSASSTSTSATSPLPMLQTMRLNVAVCPNDPYLVDPASLKAQALLSYGVNDGFFVSYGTLGSSKIPISSKQGLDRNGNQVAPAVLSKLTSRPNSSFPRGEACSNSTTIMIGERTGDGSATYPRASTTPTATTTSYQTSLKWIDQNWNPASPTTGLPPGWYAQDWNDLTFHWTNVGTIATGQPWPTAPMPAAISPNMMVSAHPGIVCVVFFDGNGQKVNNDAVYPQ